MSPELARAALLRAEIARDWQQVRTLAERVNSVDASKGPAEAALVALSLDHAYQAFETLLLRVERALGLPERTRAGWHRSLLSDAALEIPELRPAIVPRPVEPTWDQLRRFRHFLRHAYAVDLDPERLTKNVQGLLSAVNATDPHIVALLTALATDLESSASDS